jgi:hypothetical protein
MLKQLWSSSKGLDSLFSYLQDKIYEVWRAPTYLPHAQGHLSLPTWPCVSGHWRPGSTLAKSSSGCLFTPRVVSIPCVLWLFLIGLISYNSGKRSPHGLLTSLSKLAPELSRATSSQGSARFHCPSPHWNAPPWSRRDRLLPPSYWLGLCLHSASDLQMSPFWLSGLRVDPMPGNLGNPQTNEQATV